MSLAELPSYDFERKKLSDDGAFWPTARAEMRHPHAIRERLAEDLRAMLKARGVDAVITTEDYLVFGWAREQVQRHGLAAARLLEADADPRTSVVRRVSAEESEIQTDRARDLANEVA
ncbi:MAG: hypothetical protein LCH39_01875 [Proteobacteria bacterium]|nr:hypothetical protein [Pseudomonadota bacterium]